jgi:hypothetical protein
MTKTITADKDLVAYCGLYCGACRSYLNEKCGGCHKNEAATWCKIRTCNISKSINSCAECNEFKNVNDCGKFNNWISKVIGVVFNSNRQACIVQIQQVGLEKHAEMMAANKRQSLPRR